MTTDGAAALCSRTRDGVCRQKPAYLLGAASGSGYRTGAMPEPASACFDTVALALFDMASVFL
ncbi:hypothetical protein LJR296_007291 [Cupriavidus necator]|uniref:hypothetical protein n=1 Tax=Cupriavidus necator TaxID=106590 RepID=UPI003ECEE093